MDPDLYKNRYRVSTARARSWDYSSPGDYFVTICTKYMKCWFGKVVEGKMQYSKIGLVAEKSWVEIPNHFPFVTLDKFVIMPNHVHGIITIKATTPRRDAINRVSTNGGVTGNNNPMGKHSLGEIIRYFKGKTTFFAHKSNLLFSWQSGYYESIIVTEKQLQKTRDYIEENPYLWKNDPYFIG